LIAAVVVACGFGLTFPALVLPDSPTYLEPARSWARGDGLMEAPGQPLQYRLPAYPLLLGLVIRAFGDSLHAITMVQVLLHVGAMLLARQMLLGVSVPAADGCAALGILYPPFLTATATVLQETMLSFLAALFAWCLWRAAEAPGAVRSFAAGASLGLAALGKVVILPLALPAAALLAMAPRRSWLRPAACLLGVATVVLPWALRNRAVLGRLEVTNGNGGHTFLGGAVSNTIEDWYGFPEYREALERWQAGGRRKEPLLDRYLFGVGLERVKAEPGRWLALVAGRVVRFMLPARHWMAQRGLSTPGTLTPFFVLGALFQGLLFLATAWLVCEVALRRLPLRFLIGPAIVFWHQFVYAVMYVSPRYNVSVGALLAGSAVLSWCVTSGPREGRLRLGRGLGREGEPP
jgi:4-amino-4-deoxy-L-arabinose transferase-like glycosyltransferase